MNAYKTQTFVTSQDTRWGLGKPKSGVSFRQASEVGTNKMQARNVLSDKF